MVWLSIIYLRTASAIMFTRPAILIFNSTMWLSRDMRKMNNSTTIQLAVLATAEVDKQDHAEEVSDALQKHCERCQLLLTYTALLVKVSITYTMPTLSTQSKLQVSCMAMYCTMPRKDL